MSDVTFLVGVGAGFAGLAAYAWSRRRQRDEAAQATGLLPADLTHLPASLRESALWALSDGGFESGVLANMLENHIEVTAFELETLRERRGEWAYLGVDQPFSLDGHLRVVIFRVDRKFPHVLLKRTGDSDLMPDRTAFERAANLASGARMLLGQKAGVEAELPRTLPPTRLSTTLPVNWRAYGDATLAALLEPIGTTLTDEGNPDQVIELIDNLVISYHARDRRMRNLADGGATPWAQTARHLIDDSLQIVRAILTATSIVTAAGKAETLGSPPRL
jgi:hypothetical protein